MKHPYEKIEDWLSKTRSTLHVCANQNAEYLLYSSKVAKKVYKTMDEAEKEGTPTANNMLGPFRTGNNACFADLKRLASNYFNTYNELPTHCIFHCNYGSQNFPGGNSADNVDKIKKSRLTPEEIKLYITEGQRWGILQKEPLDAQTIINHQTAQINIENLSSEQIYFQLCLLRNLSEKVYTAKVICALCKKAEIIFPFSLILGHFATGLYGHSAINTGKYTTRSVNIGSSKFKYKLPSWDFTISSPSKHVLIGLTFAMYDLIKNHEPEKGILYRNWSLDTTLFEFFTSELDFYRRNLQSKFNIEDWSFMYDQNIINYIKEKGGYCE